jgi:Heat induced stress protein YflT domain
MPTSTSAGSDGTRRAVSSVDNYKDAQHAVDWLSDHDFPVERVSIVGTGLRYVEQVSGRMTTGRATLLGTGYGALIGLFWGLLFGLLFTFDSGSFWGLLGFSVLIGAVVGALLGAIGQYAKGGERDFTSTADTRADHYEVQVESGYAAEAQRVLTTMPAA